MGLHVEFAGIGKDFGSVSVLRDISLALEPGRVYGLLGENGAGKSTLMKILAGYLSPTRGEVRIDGHPTTFANSREAEALGIVMVHQELNLVDALTVTQNMFLGHEIKKGWFLDEGTMRAKASEALAQVGAHGDPNTPVGDLIVAEKQLVEIAKAQVRDARLLILDEPTASLTPNECEHLFALISRLRAMGLIILYISHKLDEVERITDEVIVLRDGCFVHRGPTAETPRDRMAALMVGRALSDMYPPKRVVPIAGTPLLAVEGLAVPGWVEDVGFTLMPGEILGFAGLVGAGRTELFEGLMGLRPRTSGRVSIEGRPVQIDTPRAAARLGVTYLSEDRKGKGLHVDRRLQENVTLVNLEAYAHPLLSAKEEAATLDRAIDRFGIRVGTPTCLASALSGGNQQKLAIAKFLDPNPRVFILDEPTRGVDVGAKRDIYFLIESLAREGRGVIVISSELVELIGLCHRVIVMRDRRISAEVPADRLSEEELLSHAIGTEVFH